MTISKLTLTFVAALAACEGSDPGKVTGNDAGVTTDDWDKILGERVPDYTAALRTAALRLTGDIPSNDEINAIAAAPDDATK